MRAVVWIVEKKWQGRWYPMQAYWTQDDGRGETKARQAIASSDPATWRVVKYVPAPAAKGGRS